MKRRPSQRTRMNAQRRRRIHTSFADTWERLRAEAQRLGQRATALTRELATLGR